MGRGVFDLGVHGLLPWYIWCGPANVSLIRRPLQQIHHFHETLVIDVTDEIHIVLETQA